MASLLNVGRALIEKLPYDAEIEYLQSSGTQWIDTDIYLSSIKGMGMDISVYHYGNSYGKNICGSDDPHGFNIYFNSATQIGFYLCYGYVSSNNAFPANMWHDISWIVMEDGTSQISIDNESLSSYKRSLSQSNITFKLYTQDPIYGRCSTIRISKCRIYEGLEKVRDFIPVRKGTTGYMYDKVSGQLFGNAGTGDFILGPDK